MYEEWLPLNVAGVYETLIDQSYFDLRPDIRAAAEGVDRLPRERTAGAVAPPENGEHPRRVPVSGTLAPVGPPSQPPTRVEAGGRCVVDVKQAYEVTGTIAGSLSVDFRILVDGPCGSPIGTFDESWIAHGRFEGTLDASEIASRLSYVADVKAGGEVSGSIVFGPEWRGKVRITGELSDGRLSYEGWVQRK
jgi:hypothetical protein